MEWRKLIFDDYGRAVPKSGEFVREDVDFVYLKNEHGIVEAISKKKIMRMEITGAGGV